MLAVFALILFLPTGIIALHKSWKVCVYIGASCGRCACTCRWLGFHGYTFMYLLSLFEWLLCRCVCTHCDACTHTHSLTHTHTHTHTHNAQVKTLCLKPGNYDKAVAASRSARFWGTLSCVIGILILLVAVIVGLVIHYSLQYES